MPLISSMLRQDGPVVRDSDGRYRAFLDHLGVPCVVLDAHCRVLYCNPSFAAFVDLPVERLLGQALPEAVAAFHGSGCQLAWRRALETHTRQEAEQTFGDRIIQVRAYPVPGGVLVLLDDLTPRRQFEEDLVQIALRGRLVLEQVPAIQWTVDPELRFTLSMGAGLGDLGLKPGQVVGLTLFDFLGTNDPEYPDIRWHREALTGQRVSYQAVLADRTYDCVLEPLREPTGRIVGVIGVAHDVTERCQAEKEQRRLEQQIYRSQKLESLGLLAGGVAHDFNNLLVGILGTVEVLLRELSADSPQRPLIELVKKAGENAAQLTRQMLTYAGKGPSSRLSLDLNALISESRLLAGAAVRKNIAFETCLAPGLPSIYADPGQIQQVVLNLILNAAEAIGARAGRITLTTRLQVTEEIAGERELSPGQYVCVQVNDNGCGMTPEVAARLFDPFFTTKASGRGLGMSVVQGIVHGHQGTIRVESVPGQGTTFRVLLPAVAEPPLTASDGALSNRAVVLVVEDEPCVREVTTRALKSQGLMVLSAASSGEGVELLQRHRDAVTVVLLNLDMPGPAASEAIAALRRLRPDLKVILTTSQDQHEAARRCEEWRLTGFLQKPFKLEGLFEKVRGALG